MSFTTLWTASGCEPSFATGRLQRRRGAEAPLEVYAAPSHLELNASGEFQLTRREHRRCNAGNMTGAKDVSIRAAGVDVIEGIERIHPELCNPAFMDCEALCQ